MRRLLSIILLLTSTTFGAYAQDIHGRLDSLMGYYASEYDFNGVALVASKGNIIFEQAYGYRDIAKKEKHDEQSIFQVGAITDQFTAEVIYQLAHEHKLGLDDKLNKYFPKFPKGDSVTIRNLLTHTSGILDYFMFDGFLLKHSSQHVANDTVMALFDKRPPQGIAGTHFQFSNSNYLLLGYIIEKITHKSYSDVFRERIFKPAGMTHSGFDYRGLKDKHVSKGYRHYRPDEKELPAMDSTLTGAAAGLYTTAGDMYAWHKALQSYKLLNKSAQDSVYMPFQHKYASGWYVDTIYDKMALVHGGTIQGYCGDIIRIPADDVCIILLQNINSPAVDENTIGRKITDALYDEHFIVPVPVPLVQLNAGELDRYAGEYLFPSGVSIVITTDGSRLHAHNVPLKGTPDNMDDFDMDPIGGNKFKTRSLNAIVEFKGDSAGGMTTLVLHSIRHDITAKKKAK